MVLINEKTGKQTLQFEKQLIKISQELSGAKPVKADDKQGGTGQGLKHSIVKDFLNFVQVLDSKNLTDMFKCQLKNKHQVEFAPSFTTDELEESVD